MAESRRILRVGIIGAGEVAQVVHLPVLSLLTHLYTTTAICDISQKTADHCAAKFHIPLATTDPALVYQSPDVDVVFVLTSDEFHEPYTTGALAAGKHVMVEKPMTLSIPSAETIIAAEADAKGGPIVFVGYMRRYATSFTQTFLRELATLPRILYARCRDFPGPNPRFVAESGAFAIKHTDDIPASAGSARDSRLDALFRQAFPGDQPMTEARQKFWRFMGTLGSHDISLMREALGFPESVAGVSVNDPMYSAILNYRNKSGEPFSVTYESGWDDVPDFDAHLAVYGEKKRVMIRYDSPFVKGLPIKVTVQEVNEYGEMETREMLGSYEDAYTIELQELYQCIVDGKSVKTTSRDALQDLKIYDMMFKKWNADTADT